MPIIYGVCFSHAKRTRMTADPDRQQSICMRVEERESSESEIFL